VLLPGLVDLHVHYPQIAVIRAMGMTLLEWLADRTLHEEARLADDAYASDVARTFVRDLARNGTTAALVLGSHFPAAQEALFAEVERSGLRTPAASCSRTATSCARCMSRRRRRTRRAARSWTAGTAAGGCATRWRRGACCRAPTR
jgi:cytosine/adenosine deaminase-related metal-dependent hydrolase